MYRFSTKSKRSIGVAAFLVGLHCSWPGHSEASATEASLGIGQLPAVRTAGAGGAEILGAARAGARLVAVGDRGVVLLSDDDGKTYRQAAAVPTRASLTATYFINERQGWAVGHWGVVLSTEDGGEHWALLRDDLQNDRPLFSVWFKDSKVGIATGLWGLVLRTTDGGKSWREVSLPPGKEGKKSSDKNLFAIFETGATELLVAAERGSVFLSRDEGLSWREVATGNNGTFWTGLPLKSGAVLVGGVRGRLYRRDSASAPWQEVPVATKSSLTAMTQLASGRIVVLGMDGLSMTSDDDGRTFTIAVRPDRLPLTAVAMTRLGTPAVFSAIGPVLSKPDSD